MRFRLKSRFSCRFLNNGEVYDGFALGDGCAFA